MGHLQLIPFIPHIEVWNAQIYENVSTKAWTWSCEDTGDHKKHKRIAIASPGIRLGKDSNLYRRTWLSKHCEWLACRISWREAWGALRMFQGKQSGSEVLRMLVCPIKHDLETAERRY